MTKPNNLILRTTSSLISFILLGFAVYLLIAGHNSPGGGFVGGLMTSGAILLMYMSYGIDMVKKIQVIPVNFKMLIPIGLIIALLTGAGSFLFNEPFLTQTFGSVQLPVFGEVELATAMLFDIGVYSTVLGSTISIILTIAEDK